MHVYPAAATIRPRFGRKTLVFRSLRPETGFLEIKTRRRADMKGPQTPLTTTRSTVTARATQTQARVGATRGQVCRVRHNYPRRTFRVRDLTTGQVTMCQVIIWHPTADAGEAVSRNTVTKVGGGDTGITRPDPRKPPTPSLHGEPGDRLGGTGIGKA